jgi:transposase
MKKRGAVFLKRGERKKLEQMVRRGKAKATEIRRANILLKTDGNGPRWTDERIAEAFGCSRQVVVNVRRRYVKRGLDGTVKRKKQEYPSRTPVLDGKGEARVLALACSQAPGGRNHWTLRMLANRVVELEIADEISHETVRQTLKKTR